ncbi:MAG: hypothetical protein WBP46_10460 [Thiolinea sp.]
MYFNQQKNRLKNTLFKLIILSLFAFMSPSYASPLNLIQSFGEPDLFNPSYVVTDNLGNTYVQSQHLVASYTYNYTIDIINKEGALIKSFPSLGWPIASTKDGSYIYERKIDDANSFSLRKYNRAGVLIKTIKINIANNGASNIAIDSDSKIYIGIGKQIFVYNDIGILIKKINQFKINASGTMKNFGIINQIYINKKNQLLITDNYQNSFDKKSRLLLMNTKAELLKPAIFMENEAYNYAIALDNLSFIYVAGEFNTQSGSKRFIKKLKPNGNLSKIIDFDVVNTNFSIDTDNNLILPILNKHLIKKYNSNGSFSTLYGNAPKKLASVADFALDSNKNLYILDNGHNRIKKFSADGSLITKNWGNPILSGTFERITITPDDKVYLQNSFNKFSVFTTEGAFLQSNDRLWPSFDKNGSEFIINNDSSNAYIEKLDSTGTKVKSIHYPTAIGTNKDLVPCFNNSNLVIDDEGNFYSAACRHIIKYSNNLTPDFQIELYLLKINSMTGAILKSVYIDTTPAFDLSLSIDKKNTIYLSSRSAYGYNANFIFNKDLIKLGEISDNAAFSSKTDIDGNLYLLSSELNQVNKYTPISLLQAPLPLSLKKLNQDGEILLSWQDKTTNETGFKIYRCKQTDNTCAFKLIATAAANTTSLHMSKPSDITIGNNTYRYLITAIKNQEESLSNKYSEITINSQ